MLPRTLKRNGWTIWHLIAVTAMTAAGVYVTSDAWLDIYHLAMRDEEFSHMYLVPLVVAWLVWVRRGRLRYCMAGGSYIGPLLVAAGWAIAALGYHNGIESFWHGGSVLIVIGCAVSILGRDVLLNFLPAFGAMAFLVPVPGVLRQYITVPLQASVAKITQMVFDIGGVTVFRAGNLLSINGADVAIAEACNGMRMVFALVMVSYCFAFSMPLRGYVRTIILLASPLSALICNVIRTIPTVWLYGYFPRVADAFHYVSGWIMLLLAFFLLMAIIRALRWALVPVTRFTLVCD